MADEVVGTDTPVAESTGSPSRAGSDSGGVTAEDVAGIAATLGQGDAPPGQVPQGPGQHGVAPRRGPGPIPFDRHKAALDNARKQAREEAEAQVRQTYGIPPDVKAEVVRYALGVADWLGRDPASMIAAVQAQLATHPGQTPKQAADAVVDKIEASLRSEDGKSVYTAEQVEQLIQRETQRIRDEISQSIEKDYRPLKEKAEAQERKAYIDQRATEVLTHYRKYPHFRELEPEMKPLVEKGVPLVEAYAYLLATKKLPQATQQTQQQTDAQSQLARKANAQGVGAARDPVSGKFMKPSEMDTIDVVRQVARELAGRP